MLKKKKRNASINRPDRQKRSERIMAPMDEAISKYTSVASPTSERNVGDDNSAADKGRQPLSCKQ